MGSQADWIAEWVSTKPLTRPWIVAGEVHPIRSNALILITDGHGVWKINGDTVHVSFGQLIAVKEGSYIEILEGGAMDLAGWQVLFRIRALFEHGRETAETEWPLPATHSWHKTPLSSAAVTALGPYMQEDSDRNAVQTRIGNQLFLYELLKHACLDSSRKEQNPEESLQRTIAFMQEHYDEVLTRKQLAEIAGLSPWHYSRKFNERYGKPPLEYLAHYRMYRAQELLLLTSATTQDIARQVGFDDVQYFSRRFKQLTGVSPRNYSPLLASRKIVALSPLCAEMLIRFGIIPHAVAVTPLLLTERQLRQFERHRIKLLKFTQFHLDAELVAQTGPDLIIGPNITEETKMKLRTISPIISIDHLNVELLIQQLAILFGKKEEARDLLSQMQSEWGAARRKLHSLLQSEAAIMLLRVEPFGYRYLGGRASGVSDLLYRQLGLSLPEPLRSGEAWFNPCSLELLAQADPDYLFVEKRVMEHFDAEAKMNELMQSSVWNNLKAVRMNRVFYVDTRHWVEGCGLDGQAVMLDQIVDALTASDRS